MSASGNPNPEEDENYDPGKKVSINEIMEKDKGDESLERYKQALLGSSAEGGYSPSDDPRKVVVKSLELVPEDHEPIKLVLDPKEELEKAAKQTYVVKEGISFHYRITFHTQHEICSGLKYSTTFYKKGIRVDKNSYMVGSYPPRKEEYVWESPPETIPSGMMARGSVKAKCLFIDDDKQGHIDFDLLLNIKKDWE
eukprot:gb/GECH01011812.1/.p1 GENE.gb/GECH01011812.1/~~gb/GECH01011812.1/.p1  ORF type:complete len:196 (+),score=51.18 gb/GECH01011812.1/:1-588(+)